MSWFVADEPERIPVSLGECRCAGAPHSEDVVYLRDKLTPNGAFAALQALTSVNAGNGKQPEEDVEPHRTALKESLGWAYVRHGVIAWTFVDAEGVEIPCTLANINRLGWDAIQPIAEKASELYSEALLRPLVAKASSSSPNGRTAKSTSRKRATSSARRKP